MCWPFIPPKDFANPRIYPWEATYCPNPRIYSREDLWEDPCEDLWEDPWEDPWERTASAAPSPDRIAPSIYPFHTVAVSVPAQ